MGKVLDLMQDITKDEVGGVSYRFIPIHEWSYAHILHFAEEKSMLLQLCVFV